MSFTFDKLGPPFLSNHSRACIFCKCLKLEIEATSLANQTAPLSNPQFRVLPPIFLPAFRSATLRPSDPAVNRNNHHAVCQNGFEEGHEPLARRYERLGYCSGWRRRPNLWWAEGPGPDFPEPLWAIPCQPPKRQEDGRLA